MVIKNLKTIFFILLVTLFFGTCGIEDYPLISPIPQSNITQQLNNRAVVRLPNIYSGTPFTHFAVFYRIYVSNVPQSSTTTDSYSAINPVLASDYNSFRTYIDSTTLVNVNMDSLFQGRGYKYLSLQEQNISNVLSSSAQGSTLVFDFSSSRAPTMTIGSSTYTMWRSDGNGLFNPRPDRLFMNKDDLWRSENINDKTNADVVNKSDISSSDRHYTYAAMFIVAVGINTASYSNIYSTPSLIHVFQLPD
jgi:hypothetical protein